jgi:hypothetical protein
VAVIARCTDAARFLAAVSATIARLKINRAETCVVVEGAAQFQDQENQTSSVASCDVFQFSDKRLIEITSYVVELNKPQPPQTPAIGRSEDSIGIGPRSHRRNDET